MIYNYAEEEKMKKRINYLIGFIVILLIEVIIALFIHDKFIRPYIGDILVVICLYLFLKSIFPEKPKYLSLFVFLFAVGVEILQYFNIMKVISGGNKYMNIILGATFDIKDIMCYLIGFIIIIIVEKIYKRRG